MKRMILLAAATTLGGTAVWITSAAEPPAAGPPAAVPAAVKTDSAPAAPSGGERKVPFGPQQEKLADENDDVVGTAVGTLAAAYLNQAYLSIGILGDAVAREVYEGEQANELLAVHLNLAEMVEEQLEEFIRANPASPEESHTVQELLKTARMIRAQGDALAAVWNGDATKAAEWTRLREETGRTLEKLFGEDGPQAGTPSDSAPSAPKQP